MRYTLLMLLDINTIFPSTTLKLNHDPSSSFAPITLLGRGSHVLVSKRPNILFITSDQQRGDCYGFEGRKIKTPHLDDMAQTFCDYGQAMLGDKVHSRSLRPLVETDAAMAKVQRELRDMIASRPDDACAPLPQVGMA